MKLRPSQSPFGGDSTFRPTSLCLKRMFSNPPLDFCMKLQHISRAKVSNLFPDLLAKESHVFWKKSIFTPMNEIGASPSNLVQNTTN